MRFNKLFTFFIASILATAGFLSGEVNAQDRERVVQTETRTTTSSSRRLTNDISVRQRPAVKKTASTKPVGSTLSRSTYLPAMRRSMMMESIKSKLGLRYRYGSQGPRTYDCSGFVWKVFNESGIPMTRSSARVYYRQFPKVTGDERFQFGTLVFFNRLGHMGIVVDRNGFYHASSSRGVTYSKFKGYWARRIVGYRRVPLSDALDLEMPEVIERDSDPKVRVIQ